MVATISCPQRLGKFTGAGFLFGDGLFDKLKIEERETWTAELWRLCGNAENKDFGGHVSSRSVKPRIPTGSVLSGV